MEVEGRHPDAAGRFEQVVLPHLDAAYNLARWLVRDPHDAEDVVQEAFLRAFQFFGGYLGGDARAWVLKIVRNTSYSYLEKHRPAEPVETFDESIHSGDAPPAAETALLAAADRERLREALASLPVRFREALVLREFEGLSYKEIAEVMGTPVGTVMSGLARARKQLRDSLLRLRDQEVKPGLRR